MNPRLLSHNCVVHGARYLWRRLAIQKREKWSIFFVKVLFVLALMAISAWAFFSRYGFGYDPQPVKSVTGSPFYLIDYHDQQLLRDGLYLFRSKDLRPIFPENTLLVKYLRGMPGDRVVIKANEQIFVDDRLVGTGLPAATKLGLPATHFVGEKTLQAGEYWFMGDAHVSFDSRYWGVLTHDRVLGRVYPLF